MKIINLTPHQLHFLSSENEELMVMPSSGVARAKQVRKATGEIINGIPVYENTYGSVEGLPEPVEGAIFVVSALTAQAVKGERSDVFIVDDAVRDNEGRIIGCRALARI